MNILTEQHGPRVRIDDNSDLCLNSRIRRPVRLCIGGYMEKQAYRKAAAEKTSYLLLQGKNPPIYGLYFITVPIYQHLLIIIQHVWEIFKLSDGFCVGEWGKG